MKQFYRHIFFFLFCSVSLQAQIQFINYKYLSQADGLPSKYVFDIEEDKYGFIWLATSGGLVRYDGNQVVKFEKTAGDSVFLLSNNITSLLTTGDSLWIGTTKGLSILNLNNGKISNHSLTSNHFPRVASAGDGNYATRVRDIFEDRQGNIWLTPAFGGFVKWEKKTRQFIEFPLYPDEKIPKNYSQGAQTSLVGIIQDVHQDSIIWGAGMTSLVKLNQETGTIQRIWYDKGNEQAQFYVNRKICIHQDPQSGLIYTGSWSGGLSIYDPKTGQYDWLSKLVDNNFAKDALYDLGHLTQIVPKGNGQLYLTYEEGLFLFDPIKKKVTTIKYDIDKGQKKVFGVDLIDSEGRVWDVNNQGVTILDPVEQQFQRHSLAELNRAQAELIPRAIVEDFYPGYISLAAQYGDGIYHINPTTGHQFKSVLKTPIPNEKTFSAWGLTKLNNDALLVSATGLYLAKKQSKQIIPFEISIPAKHNITKRVIKDDFGKIWLGTLGDGLVTIDDDFTNTTSHYPKIPYANVYKPFQDSRQNIWTVTNYGHVVFDRQQQKFHVFDYNQDPSKTFIVPREYCECPNGEVWFAGETHGIGLLSSSSPEKGIIKKIILKNKKGKLLRTSRIACSPTNELWAMNSGGLIKINREDWTCEFFSTAYGVKDWHGMFQFLKNGDLFICSRDGFYTVDPNQLRRNNRLPKPYVARVISNKGIKNNTEAHLKKSPIHLEADENVITIDFSAINHTLASRTKFQYMLEGLNEEWIDPGKERSLNYSFIPGGDYIFKLRASNNEGVWNEEIYELPIHVETPWYKTSLFWLIVSGALLGLGYAYYRERIFQVRKESNLKAEFEKQKADLEMSALRAQMNPHFIFNCLNSIESYIIKNDTKKASAYLNNFSRLVRLILQNSRTSYVNLQDELDALELYIKLEQMRLRNSFSYEIIIEKNLSPENFEIPPMLIQPFVENSIWHGLQHLESGGKVKIEIQKEGESLRCIIEDNGIGRIEAGRIKAAKKIKRKSMGMSITNKRIEMINKTYDTFNEVEIKDLFDNNQKALGTRVILNIPL